MTGLLLAGCSGAPPEPPAPLAVPVSATPTPPAPPGAVPGPTAVGVAQASADPTTRFVLAAGEPARCLERRDGAVSAPCRRVEGQAWSFRALPDGTFRIGSRTRDGDLCLDGAPDRVTATPCGRSAGQVWRVAATGVGFQRLGTDVSGLRCLSVATGIAMVPCEPLERPPGAPRTAQDWELTPAPPLPEAPPRTTTRPAPTTTTRPAPRPSAAGDVLARVNTARSSAGCSPLRRDARLDRAAAGHAAWMTAGGEFSHTGKGGTSSGDRIRGQGWSGSTGENIAEGQTSAAEVMTDWMNSPEHRRNIEDCEFTSMGLARSGSMWVQTFGG